MSAEDEKLQKVLARAGIGSRREMERAIADGRVKVNGETATLGDRVDKTARIVFDGKPVKLDTGSTKPRVLLYNKPEGEICSRKDPEGRRSVFDRLPRLNGERWICVGSFHVARKTWKRINVRRPLDIDSKSKATAGHEGGAV